MTPLRDRFQNQRPAAILAQSFGLVVLIGIIDYVTGYNVSLFVFYALPIFLVVWFHGRTAGAIICLACGAAWFISDLASGHRYQNPAVLVWNTAVELGFFVFAMLCASAVKFRFKRSQAKVEELERFHLLAQISPVGIFRSDAGGRTIYVNGRWCNITGLQAEDALGKIWTEALHPDDRGRVADEWRRASEAGRPFAFEARFLQPDGSAAWGLGQVAPEVDTTDKGYVGAVTDLTSHRRLEREILEISEKEQQRIGQDLHDDLCQYLVAIQYTASALRGDLQRQDAVEAAAAQEVVDLLKEAVVRTRNLARGIFPVRLEQAGLISAMEELAAMAEMVFAIACTFEMKGEYESEDRAVATHLYRIAQEALHNAIKHGKATQVEIRFISEDGWLKLTVEDDGDGLPPDAYEESKGMGLRIMHYRSHMIGGALQIEKNEFRGTTVTCTLRKPTPQLQSEMPSAYV